MSSSKESRERLSWPLILTREDSQRRQLFSAVLWLFSSTAIYSCILWTSNFFNLNAVLKKIIKYPRRRKIPDFLLELLTFFTSGSKIPHRRSLRVASQQTGWFTPTDCLGLLQVCSWGVLSTCRWKWNYRFLILALVLLVTRNLVLCTNLALLKMGSCTGMTAGNALPLEGRGGRGCRCSRLPPAYSHYLWRGQEQLRQVMVHCISPPPLSSLRIWCLLCKCLRPVPSAAIS